MQRAKDREFWRSFTATRQQSLAAMQAAARSVRGADNQQSVTQPEIFGRDKLSAGEGCCR
ncbi:hypothetical protein CIT292_07646 [Citrobacter youngae ATCC 29220]|uniref:Uncharacterized protein n=1 Tax=Citrobacter youngae ATCC 29220 TaxID=500640 RepID=D4BAZ9_9ENTR|nr:hypothetical protein CIT292_07646 [Citrobacter youngae ATCC 29220]